MLGVTEFRISWCNFRISWCNFRISEFLDVIYSSYLISHISFPTRLTRKSHTLIVNITGNVITKDAILGNYINTISDHLSQFLSLPRHSITPSWNWETFQRNLEILERAIFFQNSKDKLEKPIFSTYTRRQLVL